MAFADSDGLDGLAPLPIGTVTFLFTDIEGSTLMLQRLGDGYAEVLLTHQRLLRAAFTAYHGVEVDTQGDSFFVAFPTAPDALAAAIEAARALAAQTWPAGEHVRVRMGLHAGAPQVAGRRYIGLDVHRAARIAAAGHGGQILLSAPAAELVRTDLPAGVALQDLGAHRLKDLQHAERLYQVAADGMPTDFPPLRALDVRPHNLPVQTNPLLGRAEEIATLLALLRRDDVRLVTLIGPGGIGKTRLSLEVGAEMLDSFPDGVWQIRLARIADATQVIPTIAQVFDIKESGAAPIADVVASALRDKRLLLILDNFEQVTAAAPDVAALLAACPGMKALATSRAPLDISSEREYVLRPLSTPDPQHLPPLERLSQYAAVALFIERAQAAQASFTITSANAPAVAEICSRLDGLPLAIELAAARIKLLPPQTLLQRLERQLATLTGGARDLDERQRTMRGAIAWSYDLLSAEERALFRRLAVFVGGWTLPLAEAVCATPDGAAPLELDILDGLTRLVDHSLIQIREDDDAEAAEDGPRFSMLHVIREYAQEQLEASGEGDALRGAHARAMLQYAMPRQNLLLENLSQDELSARARKLKRERDNLRAALDWASRDGDLAMASHLFVCINDDWHNLGLGNISEGRVIAERLFARLFAASGGSPNRPEPLALMRTPESWLESVALDVRVLVMLFVAGWALSQNDYLRARDVITVALDWARALDDTAGAYTATGILGQILIGLGDKARGLALIEEHIALARQIAPPWMLANRLATFAYFLLADADDAARAESVATEAGSLGRQVHNAYVESFADLVLALVALSRGDTAKARVFAHEALALTQQTESAVNIPMNLVVFALIAAQRGAATEAARIYGAATAEFERRGTAQGESESALNERFLAPARAALSADAWATEYQAGRALTIEEARAEAQAQL